MHAECLKIYNNTVAASNVPNVHQNDLVFLRACADGCLRTFTVCPLVWFDGRLDTPQNRVKPTAALLPLWGGKTARYAKIPCKSDLHGRISPDTLSRLVLT